MRYRRSRMRRPSIRRRRRNPAGPLLMVNPARKRKRKKTATRKKRKSTPRNRKGRFVKSKTKRKNPKRVAAGKRAWAKRKRKSNPKRRKKTPKRRRRTTMAKRKRKSPKRVAAGKKAARTRKRRMNARRKTRKKNPKRRRRRRNISPDYMDNPRRKRKKNPVRRKRRKTYRRRRRNTWFGQPRRHKKAAKRGWWGRRRGKKYPGRKRYTTSRGRKYKRPTQYRGKYSYWKNPIRTKNPGAMADIVLPAAMAIGGMVAAGLLMAKLPASIKSKIPTVAGVNLGILVPAAAGVVLMKFLPKKVPQYSKVIYGLGFGMVLASGMALYNTMIAPKANLPQAGALAGYVTHPFSGYVRAPFSGYVPAGLGQLDEIPPRSLGAPVGYRGAVAPTGLVPTKRMLAYQPQAVKPYGLGVPQEHRRYNEFSWRGVYGKSVYEK